MNQTSNHPTDAQHRARSDFVDRFGSEPMVVSRAPGRVNLIGDHTDYNDGFVLPIALPYDTVIAARPNADRKVHAHSEGYGSTNFELSADPLETTGWGLYLHAMSALLDSEGVAAPGWDGCIASDIPSGAGLSTSAALEVAAGLLTVFLADSQLEPHRLARLGQRVENEFLGLPSGVMDQLASATSTAGFAALIDCRDLSVTPVALPDETSVVVMDTGTRRALVDSAFSERAASCRSAAQQLGVTALRDVGTVKDLRPIANDKLLYRRAAHVVTENQRVLDAVKASRSGDSELFGQLMTLSHISLSDQFEVSSPALDRIVEVAKEAPGCLGARMTGGGFAGCAVALVREPTVGSFCDHVARNFVAPAQQPAVEQARLYVVRPSAGASTGRVN